MTDDSEADILARLDRIKKLILYRINELAEDTTPRSEAEGWELARLQDLVGSTRPQSSVLLH